MKLKPRSVEKKGRIHVVVAGTLDDGSEIEEQVVARDGIRDAAVRLAELVGVPAWADDFTNRLTHLLDQAELVARVGKAIKAAIKRKKPAAVFDLAEDLAHLPPVELAKAKAELKLAFETSLNMNDLMKSISSFQKQERADQTRTTTDDDGLLRICINGRQLRDITEDSLLALTQQNVPPSIFLRGGKLAWLPVDEKNRVSIGELTEAGLRGRLERSANYYSISGEAQNFKEVIEVPPIGVVRDIMALNVNSELAGKELQKIPALEAVVESPVVRPDGTILLQAGYDPKTRLYFAPSTGMSGLHVDMSPSPAVVAAAVKAVGEMFCNFPFVDQASRANFWGYLITLFVRSAIVGKVPLCPFDKPAPGTGASTLVEAAVTLFTGRDVIFHGDPDDDDEWRKLITTILSSGAAAVVIDNVEHVIESEPLARLITHTEWGDRILGATKDAILPARAVWAVTGNNISIGRNMARRCYQVRLDAKMSDPSKRKGFKHPELIPWVVENRPRLVAAVLTICRAWYAAGKPAANSPAIGSFEAWSRVVGGILAHAGIRSFLGNWEAMLNESGDETRPWEAFLTAISDEYGTKTFTIAHLVKDVAEKPAIRDAVPPDLSVLIQNLPATDVMGTDKVRVESRFKQRLGMAFKKRDGMRFGDNGIHIKKAGEDPHTKAAQWVINAGTAENTNSDPRSSPRHANGSGSNSLYEPAETAETYSNLNGEKRPLHTGGTTERAAGDQVPVSPRKPPFDPPKFDPPEFDPDADLADGAGDGVYVPDGDDEVERAAMQQGEL